MTGENPDTPASPPHSVTSLSDTTMSSPTISDVDPEWTVLESESNGHEPRTPTDSIASRSMLNVSSGTTMSDEVQKALENVRRSMQDILATEEARGALSQEEGNLTRARDARDAGDVREGEGDASAGVRVQIGRICRGLKQLSILLENPSSVFGSRISHDATSEQSSAEADEPYRRPSEPNAVFLSDLGISLSVLLRLLEGDPYGQVSVYRLPSSCFSTLEDDLDAVNSAFIDVVSTLRLASQQGHGGESYEIERARTGSLLQRAIFGALGRTRITRDRDQCDLSSQSNPVGQGNSTSGGGIYMDFSGTVIDGSGQDGEPRRSIGSYNTNCGGSKGAKSGGSFRFIANNAVINANGDVGSGNRGPDHHDYSFARITAGGHIGSHNDSTNTVSGNVYSMKLSTINAPTGHITSNNKGELGEIKVEEGSVIDSSNGNVVSGISHPYRSRI